MPDDAQIFTPTEVTIPNDADEIVADLTRRARSIIDADETYRQSDAALFGFGTQRIDSMIRDLDRIVRFLPYKWCSIDPSSYSYEVEEIGSSLKTWTRHYYLFQRNAELIRREVPGEVPMLQGHWKHINKRFDRARMSDSVSACRHMIPDLAELRQRLRIRRESAGVNTEHIRAEDGDSLTNLGDAKSRNREDSMGTYPNTRAIPDKPNTSAATVCSAAASTETISSDHPVITLATLAEKLHKSKDAIRKAMKNDPNAPKPVIKGGIGKADFWDWFAMRDWGGRSYHIDIGEPVKAPTTAEK